MLPKIPFTSSVLTIGPPLKVGHSNGSLNTCRDYHNRTNHHQAFPSSNFVAFSPATKSQYLAVHAVYKGSVLIKLLLLDISMAPSICRHVTSTLLNHLKYKDENNMDLCLPQSLCNGLCGITDTTVKNTQPEKSCKWGHKPATYLKPT